MSHCGSTELQDSDLTLPSSFFDIAALHLDSMNLSSSNIAGLEDLILSAMSSDNVNRIEDDILPGPWMVGPESPLFSRRQ